ncbi:hypothetical protein MHYP_G00184350 [Metynnis hypsauchen]
MELLEAVDCCGRDLGHSPFSPPACGSSGDPRPPAAPLREYVMTAVPGSFTPPALLSSSCPSTGDPAVAAPPLPSKREVTQLHSSLITEHATVTPKLT